jgi:hypothetical protein
VLFRAFTRGEPVALGWVDASVFNPRPARLAFGFGLLGEGKRDGYERLQSAEVV